MKQKLFYALGLIGLVMAVSASTTHAQTTANGPYYAPPSWDQTLPSSTRFIILSNFNSAAVLDRNTGLVWEKSPATTEVTWSAARSNCGNKNVGGQKGWRLPSFAELASLIDPSVPIPGPTLPPGHPFTNVQSAAYFSATTNADSPGNAWGVFFNLGFVGNLLPKPETFFVWCVRGGMNADNY